MVMPMCRTTIGIMRLQSNEPTKTKKAMKKFLSMAALALVGAVMTGCSNEDDSLSNPPQPENTSKTVTLTTTVSMDGGTTRALTSEGVKTFTAGEQMAVIYKNTSGTTVKVVSLALTGGDITNSGKSAKFTVTLDDPDKTQNVTYIYPAAMAKDDGSVNYEALASQDGTLATLASTLDLCTKSGSWIGDNLPTLTLENQFAILAITLKNSDGSSDITSTITGMTISEGTNSYTVTRSAAVGPIYVAIRPTTSAAIDIIATAGSTFYAKSLTGKTYLQNNGYNVSWMMTALPEGALSGKFTINGSGKQVYFSKGNLQATTTDLGKNWSWGFAEHQWDYIGGGVANNCIGADGKVSENGTVDLFGWVGESSEWTGALMYGVTSAGDGGYGGTSGEALKSDWGNTMGTGWFTLSHDEWDYVFNGRFNAGNLGGILDGNSRIVWTMSTIRSDVSGGVYGIILFPDDVEFASSEFSSTCTSAQWTALEAKGCVFLPASGWRNCPQGGTRAGEYGFYWSSSLASSGYAYLLEFSYGPITGMTYNLYYGFAVRLVRNVN